MTKILPTNSLVQFVLKQNAFLEHLAESCWETGSRARSQGQKSCIHLKELVSSVTIMKAVPCISICCVKCEGCRETYLQTKSSMHPIMWLRGMKQKIRKESTQFIQWSWWSILLKSFDNPLGSALCQIWCWTLQTKYLEVLTFLCCFLATCLSSSAQKASSSAAFFFASCSAFCEAFLSRASTAFEFSPLNFFGMVRLSAEGKQRTQSNLPLVNVLTALVTFLLKGKPNRQTWGCEGAYA